MNDAPDAPRALAATAEPGQCPRCGEDVPVLEALVYHGHVYHFGCIVVQPAAGTAASAKIRRRAAPWPLGVPEFNCSGDL